MLNSPENPPLHLPVFHTTELPSLNSSVSFVLRWSIIEQVCRLRLEDPYGVPIHEFSWKLGEL